MSEYRKNLGGISGGLAEQELFGEVFKPIEHKWVQDHRNEIGPLNYERAKDLVKRLQPWADPFDPDPLFANELHLNLAQIVTPEDFSQLHFYTAVHHYFDYLHGVDAFFELKTEDGIITVTLDASKMIKEEFKADVLVHYPESLDPMDKLDRQKWHDLQVDICSQILDVINDKKERIQYGKSRK
jgi:hypothetical protein